MDHQPRGFGLRVIQAWAAQNFTDDFDQLPGPDAFTIQYNYVIEKDLAHRHGILVGSAIQEFDETMSTSTDILAWLEDSCVTVGYIVQPTPFRKEIRYKKITNPTVTFMEPFCWLLHTRDQTAISRFEAFVPYAFLIASGQYAVPAAFRYNWTLLTEHFPGACSLVTRGMAGRQAERVRRPQTCGEYQFEHWQGRSSRGRHRRHAHFPSDPTAYSTR
jgi:hypothetical protein